MVLLPNSLTVMGQEIILFNLSSGQWTVDVAKDALLVRFQRFLI